MYKNNADPNFSSVLNRRPQAIARVRGSGRYPSIYGTVRFYQTNYGVVVFTQIGGLPNPVEKCESPIFAFHIHGGTTCTGDSSDPFSMAGTHYDPYTCPHPYHAGDLPPLFGANGFAYSAFLTDRFSAAEIIGKTVVIHSEPDDFTTQPSGNSGIKLACGEILAVE